jgi:hypothetical protein
VKTRSAATTKDRVPNAHLGGPIAREIFPNARLGSERPLTKIGSFVVGTREVGASASERPGLRSRPICAGVVCDRRVIAVTAYQRLRAVLSGKAEAGWNRGLAGRIRHRTAESGLTSGGGGIRTHEPPCDGYRFSRPAHSTALPPLLGATGRPMLDAKAGCSKWPC